MSTVEQSSKIKNQTFSETRDPNYQTMAGIGGADAFGEDKKKVYCRDYSTLARVTVITGHCRC